MSPIKERKRELYITKQKEDGQSKEKEPNMPHTQKPKMGEYKHTHTHKHTRGNLKKKENLITILGDDDDLIIFPLRTQSHGELSILVSLDAIPFLLPTLYFK
jgi:hypothetical protein